MQSARMYASPRGPAAPHTAIKSAEKLRHLATCAHPAHVDYAPHANNHAGMKEHPPTELAMPVSAPPAPAFGLVKPCPTLFSEHKPSTATQAAPSSDACASAEPAAPAEDARVQPANWAHPYPEKPGRWKVDEDAWYVPPENWLRHSA